MHVNAARQSLRGSTGTKKEKREDEGGNLPEIHELIFFE